MAGIPNVTAIGTCRVHNPLSKLDKMGEIRLNHNPANQFVHTSGEIIQRIGVLRNGDGCPREIEEFVFDEVRKENKSRYPLEETDVFVIEISSLKSVQFSNYHLQFNRLVSKAKEELGEGFPDWMATIRREMKDGRDPDVEISDFDGVPDLMGMSKIGMQDELSLERDIRKIISELGNRIIFVNHIAIGKSDGQRLISRDALCKMMWRVVDRLGVNSFDPTNLVIENGREEMLLRGGEDINHYSDFGEGIIGSALELEIEKIIG